ncbi:choice-of-anchor Q domain-containing protein, partial [Verrucomicrobiota bacterium]
MREAIANVVPIHGHIVFYNSLNGGTVQLTSPLVVNGKPVAINPVNLPSGLTLTGLGGTRVFEVRNGGSLSVSNCVIRDGSSSDGGAGILNDGGTVAMNDCTLRGNSAGGALGEGGAIRALNGANTTLNRCRLEGNSAVSGGGAISSIGALVCTDTSFHGNSSGDFGGALYCSSGSVNLNRCTFGGSSAVGDGGAIYDNRQSETIITHCTVSDNGAGSAAGIHTEGLLFLDCCTVADNTADLLAGGVHVSAGSMMIENTIVAGNTAPEHPDLCKAPGAAPITVIGSNLIGNNSTVAAEFPAGPLAGTPASPLLPLLAPLADFGGHTEVMIVLPGSPAIETGSTTYTEDQLMRSRPYGPLPDVGAVEARIPTEFDFVDLDNDGIDDRLEPAYGLVVGEDDSGVDTDQDGSPDAEELGNMTNPLDPSDFFRIVSIARAAGYTPADPRFAVAAATFPGLWYTFLSGESPAGPFQPY